MKPNTIKVGQVWRHDKKLYLLVQIENRAVGLACLNGASSLYAFPMIVGDVQSIKWHEMVKLTKNQADAFEYVGNIDDVLSALDGMAEHLRAAADVVETFA